MKSLKYSKIIEILYNSIETISDITRLLTNTQCIVCGRESNGHRLCKRCLELTHAPPSTVTLIHRGLEIYYFGIYKELLRDFILSYKYQNHDSLHKEFAQMIARTIKFNHLDFDYITYVPATKSAKKKRGYDHMNLIAKRISKMLDIPFVQTMKAVRETDQLVAKNREEAVKGKFILLDNLPNFSTKSILIIDDVYTSGSTMREAIKTLEYLKPKEVIPIVIAMNRG